MKNKEEKSKEKILSTFNIDIVALQNKTYNYDYVCDKDFFACFETSLLETGNCEAKIALTKSETMLTVVFQLLGSIVLVCDRSLETFDYPIEVETIIYFKYGEKAEELSEDIIVVPRNTATIELASYVYELIALEVPMKKLHPQFLAEEQENQNEELLVYTSATAKETEEEATPLDPRWTKLKKIL
jgi:uncharacterized protein